jgi:hypothetical protein
MAAKLVKLFAFAGLGISALAASTPKKYQFKPEAETTWQNVSLYISSQTATANPRSLIFLLSSPSLRVNMRFQAAHPIG